MDQALRNLVEIGLELDDASRRLSAHPARYIGEPDRDAAVGPRHADLVLLRPDLQLRTVFVEGENLELAHA